MKNRLTFTKTLSIVCLLSSFVYLISCGDDDEPQVQLSDEKEILSFVLADLDPAVTATIDGTTISAIVPFGTDLTSLSPTVTISPDATVDPESGIAQDFSEAVTYTVTAEDGSTTEYTATVSAEAGSSEKAITSFVFEGLDPDVTATIDGTTITASVPFGTDLTTLVPTIEVSLLASVDPASGAAQDFSNPVVYTVTAQDESTETYTITVSEEAASTEKEITSFVFEGLSPDVTATISGTAIAANVPFGTDVTTLVPTIELSDFASVDPTGGAAQDFSSSVDYTVTAQDNTTAVYTVTVTVLPKPGLTITPVWELNNNNASTPPWFTANNDPDIAYGNGSVYAVNNRDKLRILDPANGNEKVVDDFISQTATGLSGIYANFSGVKVDDAGNIVACTGTLPGGNFYVFKWDDESATQETILTASSVYRIDNFAVVGDMDGAGYIYAASNGANEIYKWEVASGAVVSTTPTTITVSEVANFGSFTAVYPLSADANSDILVNGNSIQPILVGSDGTVKEELPGGTIAGFSSDLIYFELGANKVLVTINTPTSDTQDLVIIDVSNGFSAVQAEDIQRVEFDDDTAGSANANATGGLDFLRNNSTSVTIYGLITNNGIGAYTITLSE